MKKRLFAGLLLLFITALALAACQSTKTPTTSSPTNVSTTTPEYPPPVQNQEPKSSAYPAPEQNPALNSLAYPGPSQTSGKFVTWPDVESALMAGKAVQAYVDQAGHVTIVLNDKSVIMSLGPTPDAFPKLVTQCGAVCKDLKVTTQ